MPMDLGVLRAKRQPKGQREPTRLPAPIENTPSHQMLAAGCVALLRQLDPDKPCICGGGGWVGPHGIGCPIPEIENALKEQPFLSSDPIVVPENAFVRKTSEGVVTIYGIPWERWLYLNQAQRADAIARKHLKPKAVQITCCYCLKRSFLLTPLRQGQRIVECWDCWSIRSRGEEAVRAYVKSCVLASRWAKSQTHNRILHKVTALKYAKEAKLALRILKDLGNVKTENRAKNDRKKTKRNDRRRV